MPKPSRYVLIWLHEREHYELHMHGHLHQRFQRGDDEAFSRWLEEHTSFAFVGKSGRISVLKEARPGGTGSTPLGYLTTSRRPSTSSAPGWRQPHAAIRAGWS